MIENEKQIKAFFHSKYGYDPDFVVRAPGRINLIGEHTDYNEGYVLPAAINKYIYFAFAKSESKMIRSFAHDLNEGFSIFIDQIDKGPKLWVNYLLGLILELRKLDKDTEGFDCVFGGDLPIGSGMSSSAALECGFLKGLCKMFNWSLSHWDLIDLSHKSNHGFLGIKGGIMDQFSILNSKKDHLILLDCQSNSFEYIPLVLDQYCILICNTMVKHNNAESGYNDVAASCKKILAKAKRIDPRITSLRMVSKDLFETLVEDLDEIEIKRLKYLIAENERVLKCVKYINESDIESIGSLLYQSHEGLQHQYKVSCEELDYLVDLSIMMSGVLGMRMMGGGFGGCTIAIVKGRELEQICEDLSIGYQQKFGLKPEFYEVMIEDGVELLE